MVRSVPAAEVTRISFAARSILVPILTLASSDGSGTSRSSASGCSFDTISARAPPPRIWGSSGACNSPSTVQSAIKVTCDSAAMTGTEPPIASLAPVERIATGADCSGVCIVTRNTLAPSRFSASSLSSTLTGRLWVSASTAQSSPASTPHRLNTLAKASIHLASIRSTSMCNDATFGVPTTQTSAD